MNVTPALLSTAALSEVQRRLEAVGGRPWMEILLTSYCDWTEYSLYLLAAERASLVARHHVWADEPAAPAHLQADPSLSVWGGGGASQTEVSRLFGADDPGLFAVVQSSSGLRAREVAAAVANHFPVRSPDSDSTAPVHNAATLRERAGMASRLAAQHIYRVRRGLRRVWVRRGPLPNGAASRRS
jgi:hypothetical protein